MLYDYINVDSTHEMISTIQFKISKGWELDGPTIPYFSPNHSRLFYLQRIKQTQEYPLGVQAIGPNSACLTH